MLRLCGVPGLEDGGVHRKREERWAEGVPLLDATFAGQDPTVEQEVAGVSVAEIHPGGVAEIHPEG